MQIAEIFASLRKSGWWNTMVMTDFRQERKCGCFTYAQWKTYNI